MRRYIFNMFLLVSTTLILAQCSSSTESNSGRLRILLTDAPASYQSVTIYFSEISAHIDSAWVNVLTEPTEVDLLQYTNGESFLLASEEIDPGHYTQIRIKIDSAFVAVDGIVHALTVPSGAQTGLKFGPQFTINEGSTYTLVIDFDADKSVVKSGQTYKLKPHIRVVAQASTGSISGTVLNPVDAPVASAIIGKDTVSTFVDVSTGRFMLAFLAQDVYEVAIDDTNGLVYTHDDVTVTAGTDKDIGDITLQ